MSYGSVVHHSIEERKAAQARRDRAAAERVERVERAKAIVVEHLSDLCSGGYVDGWAVQAVLALGREGERITEARVRRRRAAMPTGMGDTVGEREKAGWA